MNNKLIDLNVIRSIHNISGLSTLVKWLRLSDPKKKKTPQKQNA